MVCYSMTKMVFMGVIPFLRILNVITNAWENRQMVIAVMMDLSKAFDTLDHTILLAKLRPCGVEGLPNTWIQSYLTSHSQSARTESCLTLLMSSVGCFRAPFWGSYCS